LVVDWASALRYGLYAITGILGLALLLWVRRSRRIHQQHEELLQHAQRAVNRSTGPEQRVRAIRGTPTVQSMADAIAGIRLPVHWQPEPAVEVGSPLILTTDKETALEMAELLSDELARLGYRIRPTGRRTARATRDTCAITIEVETSEPDSVVSSCLTLTDVGRG